MANLGGSTIEEIRNHLFEAREKWVAYKKEENGLAKYKHKIQRFEYLKNEMI